MYGVVFWKKSCCFWCLFTDLNSARVAWVCFPSGISREFHIRCWSVCYCRWYAICFINTIGVVVSNEIVGKRLLYSLSNLIKTSVKERSADNKPPPQRYYLRDHDLFFNGIKVDLKSRPKKTLQIRRLCTCNPFMETMLALFPDEIKRVCVQLPVAIQVWDRQSSDNKF